VNSLIKNKEREPCELLKEKKTKYKNNRIQFKGNIIGNRFW